MTTLAGYIARVEAAETPRPALTVDAALRALLIAAENFRRQTSRAQVDPHARESARSAGLLLDTAIADAKHADANRSAAYSPDFRTA
jgi:hypothetical protein